MDEPEVTVTTDEAGEEFAELDLVRKALLEGDLTLDVDPAAIARRILEEILAAPNVEAAFKEKPIWHANEVVGQTFLLRGVKWNRSTVGEGPSVYAVLDAVNVDTGEVGLLTTSAYKHLGKVFVLCRDDAFPRRVRISTTLRPTAGGFYPLDFEDVAEPTPEG